MRGRLLWGPLLLVAVNVACTSGKSGNPATTLETSTTASTAVGSGPGPTPTTAAAPTGSVTLRANGVRLVNSEESDNAFRAFVDAASAEVTVVLTGIPSPNRVIFVCPARELERRVSAPGCVTPTAGEAVRLASESARGVEVVQLGVAGTGPAAASTLVGEIAVTYAPASREVRFRLPPLREGESGGTPTFALSPVGPGTYRATANWTVATGGGSGAELTMTVGGNVVARAEGPPGSLVNGNVSPPAEGTLRLRNAGSTTLSNLTVTALFP